MNKLLKIIKGSIENDFDKWEFYDDSYKTVLINESISIWIQYYLNLSMFGYELEVKYRGAPQKIRCRKHFVRQIRKSINKSSYKEILNQYNTELSKDIWRNYERI